MSTPDYLLCLECESPAYVFEWREGRVIEALCTVCGEDDPSNFSTQEEYDALAGDRRWEREE